MPRRRRIAAVRPNAEFAEAAERHLDDVLAFLVYLTGDRNVAEDLTAETFARALERWRRYDPRRGSARTWLCQLARWEVLFAEAQAAASDDDAVAASPAP